MFDPLRGVKSFDSNQPIIMTPVLFFYTVHHNVICRRAISIAIRLALRKSLSFRFVVFATNTAAISRRRKRPPSKINRSVGIQILVRLGLAAIIAGIISRDARDLPRLAHCSHIVYVESFGSRKRAIIFARRLTEPFLSLFRKQTDGDLCPPCLL
jgi:hypothetical protein